MESKRRRERIRQREREIEIELEIVRLTNLETRRTNLYG